MFPTALIYGIVGIIRDQRKFLAVVSAVIGGAAIAFFVYMEFLRV
jgi:hypothetical protein